MKGWITIGLLLNSLGVSFLSVALLVNSWEFIAPALFLLLFGTLALGYGMDTLKGRL